MASASKFARTTSAAVLAVASLFSTVSRAQEPLLCGAAISQDSLPALPENFYLNIRKVQQMLSDIVLTNERDDQTSLMQPDDIGAVFLNEAFTPDADQLAGLKQYEMPKYRRMAEAITGANDRDMWNALPDRQKRQSIIDIKMGIAAIFNIIPVEILEEIGFAETMMNEMARWDTIAPLEFEANDMDEAGDSPAIACGDIPLQTVPATGASDHNIVPAPAVS